jgi:hypothetical protein
MVPAPLHLISQAKLKEIKCLEINHLEAYL